MIIMNKILEEYYTIREQHDEVLEKLEMETQRIVNVIKSIFKSRNSKNGWWSFKYYHDSDDDSPLPKKLDGDCFEIYIDADCDSGKWSYNEGFPIKFFDMTDEEIKNHIQKEIDCFSKKEEKRKELEKKKREERKLKVQELKNSASQKLTKEERKALGLK